MHRVASAGNTSNSSRPRKEKRLTYVLNDADDTKHCAGINCLALSKSSVPDRCDYLFTGSRDGTLKRWALAEDAATCSATFESHVDWVNDVVLAGDTLVSCSSDTTLKGNIVASGGLGGEVFIWDLEAALLPVEKSIDAMEDDSSNGITVSGHSGLPITGLLSLNSSSNISLHTTQSHGYRPLATKGHKESVYALAMNESGTLLVSGGTEKVVRVWDPRTGSKNMKLRGHTDNIRALLLDATGSLWDLGQQRCVHSYAVHTDSVWSLASTPTFSHVYSGGRDLSLYLTDLSTRESLLLCTNEHPILQLALQDDGIWVATADSSLHRWPAEGRNPQKAFQRGGSFLAGNLSFTRARACLEGSTPAPVYKEPSLTVPGTPGIVKHEILNNRRLVLTKDTADSVKLWEITRGIVVEDYGKISFEEKKEELFEMISIPAWFTTDTRLGSLSVHLETPQCFSAEMYAVDLNLSLTSEEIKINLAQETLCGLLAHWLTKRKKKCGSPALANGDIPLGKDISIRTHSNSRLEADDNFENHGTTILPPFEFSTVSPPSIITEGSHGGPWRKKITELDGTEDEKDFPWWCLDCVLNGRLPHREISKYSFYLHPHEGSTMQLATPGKLSAPRILRIHKVANYVLEKMLLGKPSDGGNSDGTFSLGLAGQSQITSIGDGSFHSGLKPWQKLKPSVEILCNNQVLSPDMSLATVRAYIWKKPDELILHYKAVQGR
ncbi:WD repeat-containing protein 48 isoform X1 [Cinnamomum micranthum f. kanehirae]|uniref:WD repeat-containing protein 48 isoform X1 n=1 Tax=Cinnamomum micranthum f. kanehirae TaxID=337451 RepID=A0A443PTL5_9MAGN|nr:WD repeat-containing protein 48 isoform X1 [Cinnamomum micranthum f. kanehirae]